MRPADARDAVALYEEAKTLRAPYERDWRMCAAYCLPRHYGSWLTTESAATVAATNDAARRLVYDATAMKSVPKYISILQRLATPDGQRWHRLTVDPYLGKVQRVREFMDDLNNLLFKKRYEAGARFVQAQTEGYASIGVYGMGPKSVMWRKAGGGIAYKSWPLRDIFILVDDEGVVTTVIRRMFLNVRQFRMKFPGLALPKCLAAEGSKSAPSESVTAEIVHIVQPRDDYDERSITIRRLRYTSYYLNVRDASYVGEEEGFLSMPYITPRTFTEPGDLYGYSPAQQAFPAIGGVSAMKKTLLKVGQKAADPPILVNDDGVISGRVDMRPGATVMGGVNRQGQKMVQEMHSQARFDVAENMVSDERGDVRDAFFVTLFEILTDTPEMTATQVVERIAEKASLVAPTMGRLQSEDLGPMIDREIALLTEKGLIPEMPPELIEAKGEYEIGYTSPAAKSLRTEDVSGFMRTFELAVNAATVTKDASPLDHFDLDVALPEIAEIQNVPARWMASAEKIAAKRQQRQDAQDTQTAVDAGPAMASVAASMMKTQQGKMVG